MGREDLPKSANFHPEEPLEKQDEPFAKKNKNKMKAKGAHKPDPGDAGLQAQGNQKCNLKYSSL